MDMLSEYLSIKMEHITSSLYSHILLWADKLQYSPLKSNNPRQLHLNGYYGLQTLVHSEEEKLPGRFLHCSFNMATTATSKSKPYSLRSQPPPRLSKSLWLSSSPALRSTVMGDVIGTESGDCMICDIVVEEEQVEAAKVEGQSHQSRAGKERSGRKRELPPPITLMRETGRMPWSFRREYSDDGRLIIMAERVNRREYVESHRENGRLAMKLVHHDDDDDSVCCEECGWPIDEEEEEELEDLVDEDEDEEEEEEEEEESGFELEFEQGGELSQKSSLENESGRCGDLRQCVSYAGGGGLVRDSDSFYLGRPGSAPLQPMTPVM